VTFTLDQVNNTQTDTTNTGIQKNNFVDEIKNFLEARYVSASEAIWRIFGDETNSQDPHTLRLPVHLEDEQNILFEEDAELGEVVHKNHNTQLTSYLELSGIDSEVQQLLYYQMPLHYIWNKSEKQWTKRQRASSTQIIGRMYFVHPSDTERFYLRILLLYRKGCASFEALRTVNGTVYKTYVEVCTALGYIADSKECHLTLEEAVTTCTAHQMRELFVLLLLNCAPTKPGELWEKFKTHMIDDILYSCRMICPDAPISDEIYNVALNKINDMLQKTGNHIENYAYMPRIWEPINLAQFYTTSNLVNEETNYNHEELNNYIAENVPKFNLDQKSVYDTIISRVDSAELGNNVYFIDGPGGTRKTFVYKAILARIRLQNHIALAVASSGIAAQLLPGARTAHSRLKLPILLTNASTCNIYVNSEYAKFIQTAKVILWDECPMMHRHAFEALDRSLRDIMGKINPEYKKIPFGNKIIIFGGDFRQILPVVRKGTRTDIVKASFNRSLLWPSIQILKLKTNMRIQRLSGADQVKAQEFAEYLLRIGEGKEETFTDNKLGVDDLIQLPSSIASQMTMKELIVNTFPTIQTR
jgi:hypothetical protein